MPVRRAAIPTTARIGRRGTLVIPAALRRRFGLEEGMVVTVTACNGGVLIKPAAVETLSDAKCQEILEGANRAYAALRADPVAWAEDQAEREPWLRLAGETLPDEACTDDDFVVST